MKAVERHSRSAKLGMTLNLYLSDEIVYNLPTLKVSQFEECHVPYYKLGRKRVDKYIIPYIKL